MRLAGSCDGGLWCRPVVRPMCAIELDRAGKALAEINSRLPLQHAPDLAIVHIDRADVDRLALGRKRDQLVAARTGDVDEQIGQLTQADWLDGADIEDLAIGGIVHSSHQERLYRVVNEREVA